MNWAVMQAPSDITTPTRVHFADGGYAIPASNGTVAVYSTADVSALLAAGWTRIATSHVLPAPLFNNQVFDSHGNALAYNAGPALSAVKVTGGTPLLTVVINGGNVTLDATGSAMVVPPIIEPLPSPLVVFTSFWVPMVSPRGSLDAGKTLTFPGGESQTCDAQGRAQIPLGSAPTYQTLGWTPLNQYPVGPGY